MWAKSVSGQQHHTHSAAESYERTKAASIVLRMYVVVMSSISFRSSIDWPSLICSMLFTSACVGLFKSCAICCKKLLLLRCCASSDAISKVVLTLETNVIALIAAVQLSLRSHGNDTIHTERFRGGNAQ